MTTIAYKDGILACDSQVTTTNGTIIGTTKRKIIELEDVVIAGSGAWTALARFIEWYKKGADEKELLTMGEDETFISFVIDKKTLQMRRYEDFSYTDLQAEFYASGAGIDLAIGAMEMGATAKEAVEIACKYDTGTGGEVYVLDLHGVRKNISEELKELIKSCGFKVSSNDMRTVIGD